MQKAFQPFDDLFIDYIKSEQTYNMNVQHYHDGYEIYLQLSGERYLFSDDICYTLKKGDLVILTPFVLHYMESRDIKSYERYVVNFKPSQLEFMLSETQIKALFDGFENTVVKLDDDIFARVRACFEQIYALSMGRHGIYGEIRGRVAYAETVKLMMNLRGIAEETKKVESGIVQKEIVTAIHYINSRYSEPIDLDETARMVHMSKYYFCRLFHKVTGVTFLTYLYNVRLSKVHRLLTETELSLPEIAQKTGFSSVAHMSGAFKKEYEVSPRNFRKENKSKDLKEQL